MKHTVIFTLNDFDSAYSFDTKQDAIDYIYQCSSLLGDSITELKQVNDIKYEAKVVKTGGKVKFDLLESQESDIAYELVISENDKIIDTRRFDNRKSALESVAELLANENTKLIPGSNEMGRWYVMDEEKKIKKIYSLNFLFLDPNKTLKSAPNKAPERLAMMRFPNTDMRQFIEKQRESLDLTKDAVKRAKAASGSGSIVGGLLMMIIGGALTFGSYSSTRPGGRYFVFSGLMIYGFFYFIAGIVSKLRKK